MLGVNVRRVIHLVTPPIVIEGYRRLRHWLLRERVWKGVYRDFSDVPVSGSGFESDTWIAETRAYTGRVLEAARRGELLPPDQVADHCLLALVVAVIGREGRRVRVLDFGGGMGVTYFVALSTLPEPPALDYHIAESRGICRAGATLLKDTEGVHFHEALPDHLSDVDVIYVNSALQYVRDYAGLIDRLARYRPRFVLYARLAAGKVPTFVTAQHNVPGSVLPYWFINLQEIVEIMKRSGYTLIFKAYSTRRIPQADLPRACRLEGLHDVLFARSLSP